MGNGLWDVLTKFTDYAHLGKLTTDFAPGLVLTLAALLALGAHTELQVFPYWKHETYEARLAEAEQQHATGADQLERTRQELLARRLEEVGLQEPAKLAKQVEIRDLVARETRLQESLDAARVVLESARTEVREAFRLGKNLEVLRNHVVGLILGALIIGVLLAQASGGFFYNGLFYKHFKKQQEEIHGDLYPEGDHKTDSYYRARIQDQDFLARVPDLEIDYYRYLEVAMNMILPALCMALVLLSMSVTGEFQWATLLLGLASLAVTYGLYRNAREQYVGYFIRKADVMQCLRDKFAEENP